MYTQILKIHWRMRNIVQRVSKSNFARLRKTAVDSRVAPWSLVWERDFVYACVQN